MDLSARSPATESLVADAVKLAEPWFPRGPAYQDRLRELTSIHQSNPFPNYALGISRASCCLCGSTFISQMMWKSCGKTEHRCRNAAAENELTLSQKVRIEIEVCTEKRH